LFTLTGGPGYSQEQPASAALDFISAVATGDSLKAQRQVATDHTWKEFGSSAKPLVGRRELARARQSLHAVIPKAEVAYKRVIANRRTVLVQGVVRGVLQGQKVASEMFYLSWIGEGDIKRSVVYWGSDVLGDPALARVGVSATKARPEVVSDSPSVALTAKLMSKLYGFAAFGLAARLAGLHRRPDLAKVALREVKADAAAKHLEATRAYLKEFTESELSLDEVSQAGDYVLATFTAKGTYRVPQDATPAGVRDLELPILVVANFAGGEPRHFQTYMDSREVARATGTK
jgi:hypothetical protein